MTVCAVFCAALFFIRRRRRLSSPGLVSLCVCVRLHLDLYMYLESVLFASLFFKVYQCIEFCFAFNSSPLVSLFRIQILQIFEQVLNASRQCNFAPKKTEKLRQEKEWITRAWDVEEEYEKKDDNNNNNEKNNSNKKNHKEALSRFNIIAGKRNWLHCSPHAPTTSTKPIVCTAKCHILFENMWH